MIRLLAPALAALAASPAFAQTLPPASPLRDAFLAGIVPYVVTFVGGMIVLLGTAVTVLVTRHLGVKNAAIASENYEKATDSAAGMVLANVPADEPVPVLTPASPAIAIGVEHMRTSFPEAVAKIETSIGRPLTHAELAADIIAKVGAMAPGIVGVGASILSGIIKRRAERKTG